MWLCCGIEYGLPNAFFILVRQGHKPAQLPERLGMFGIFPAGLADWSLSGRTSVAIIPHPYLHRFCTVASWPP